MQQKDDVYPNIVHFLDEKRLSFRCLIIAFGSLGVQNYEEPLWRNMRLNSYFKRNYLIL